MPSNGQFWYGKYGFLYKKNNGVGGRKIPAYGLICNQPQYIYNKYSPGQSGIGAQSTSVRRSKNRLATICNQPNKSCGNFYPYLGIYNKYLYNPNGYTPIPN